MKYYFDNFEIELIGNNKAKLYVLGSKKGKEYTITIKEKSWFQKIFCRDEKIKKIPNIILIRGLKKIKLSIVNINKGCYQYFATPAIMPFIFDARSKYFVLTNIFDSLIQGVQKNA